jgi:hypothetical protein
MARRRLIRPSDDNAFSSPNHERSIQKLRARLQQQRTALVRWQKKLKRAFNAVTRLQTSITRSERQLSKKETP